MVLTVANNEATEFEWLSTNESDAKVYVGSIETLLQAMEATPSVAEAQESGLRLLHEWLATRRGNPTSPNTCNKRGTDAMKGAEGLNVHGLVTVIIQALSTNMNVEAVHVAGMEVLEDLLMELDTLEERQALPKKKETIAVVVGSMQQHLASPGLQTFGCNILRRLAVTGAREQEQVLAHGGASATVNAMCWYPDDPRLQAAACKTLKELAAYNMTGSKEVVRCGGIYAVLNAMQTHHADLSVQEGACGVIRNMTAGNAECQMALVASQGIEVVLSIMAEHLPSSSMQCAGCWALFCTVVYNRETQKSAVLKGALAAISLAMDEHSTNVSVQEAACFALKELAQATTAKDIPQASRASIGAALVAKIEAALRRHASVPTVQTAGNAALKAMLKCYATGNAKAPAEAHASKPRCRVDASKHMAGRRLSQDAQVLPVVLE